MPQKVVELSKWRDDTLRRWFGFVGGSPGLGLGHREGHEP